MLEKSLMNISDRAIYLNRVKRKHIIPILDKIFDNNLYIHEIKSEIINSYISYRIDNNFITLHRNKNIRQQDIIFYR